MINKIEITSIEDLEILLSIVLPMIGILLSIKLSEKKENDKDE